MAADIPSLEVAFTRHPSLDTCLPLCDAYLRAKRYMEALVVCKKGIKLAAADDSRGRYLLCRVYMEQGKRPRAEEEMRHILTAAAGSAPAPAALEAGLRKAAALGVAEPAAALSTELPPAVAAASLGAPAGGGSGGPPAGAAGASGDSPAGAAGASGGSPDVAAGASGGSPAGAAGASEKSPPGDAGLSGDQAAAAGASGDASADARPDARLFTDHLRFATPAPGAVKTAGTGRLTILGFVPLPMGSWKVTLAVLFLVVGAASAYLTWMQARSRHNQEIAAALSKLHDHLAADTYADYLGALEEGEAVLRIDGKHGLTLSAMSFAQAVLAIDHQEPAALAKAADLATAARQVGAPLNEYLVAAEGLIHYGRGDFAAGLAAVLAVVERGARHPLVLAEALRLASRLDPDGATAGQLVDKLRDAAGGSRHGLYVLGWTALQGQRLGAATAAFEAILAGQPPHSLALLGRALTALSSGAALDGRLPALQNDARTVLALPQSACSERLRSLNLFLQSELRRWQGDRAAAESSLAAALHHGSGGETWLPLYRSQVLLRAGNPSLAGSLLQEVVSADPSVRSHRDARIAAALQADDLAFASTALDRARGDDPGNARLLLLQAQLAVQHHEEAVGRRLLDGLASRPDKALQAEVALCRAAILRHPASDAGRAVTLLEQTLSQSDADLQPLLRSRLHCGLARSALAAQRADLAEQHFALGAKDDPLNADCQRGLCHAAGNAAPACGAARRLAAYAR